MQRLLGQVGIILLVCLGVRVAAALIGPAVPGLLALGLLAGIAWLLLNRRHRGYR
jgi:hypothetical protein